ncbi:MAG: hypothetical protein JSV03_05400 [Planctomycetota bacterium]|nr:MAG: hypothetical protein JSV03_05400 [Planctomycetota bacterium]
MLNFDNLQTPPDDGDVLIEPAASSFPELIDNNIRGQQSQNVMLADVPLDAARQAARDVLYGSQADKPVIACGHQPAFIHPGVWAKQVVIRHVADSLTAAGIDFVVDNDSPTSSALQIPIVESDGLLGTRYIAFTDASAGSAYEGRPPLQRVELKNFKQELRAATDTYSHDPVLTNYLDGFSQVDDIRDVVQQHLAGRLKTDAPLGADINHLRVSEVFGGPFVADLLLNAERFADAYNRSLTEYRRLQKVRSFNRPLPDLARKGDRIETALWIYRSLQKRRRLWIEHHGDRIDVYADNECVGALNASDLTRDVDTVLAGFKPWVVRPRALSLMLWIRLLACDLFVHGIGGAKYDRITDGIFRRYYQCEPPAYVCVSATLRLPLPRQAVTIDDLAAARLRRRDYCYNPDRYLGDAPPDLLSERLRLIQESDRLRREQAPRLARWETFSNIRRINDELVRSHPEIERQLVEDLDRIGKQIQSNRIADSREYFYALQTREGLAMLADRLVEATGYK